MLIYIRKCDEESLLRPVDASDIPQHLVEAFEEEQQREAQTRKEREEAHLYSPVHVSNPLCCIEQQSTLLH
jgi:ubiquitin carboxyl-terminal hydrolase 7